MEPTKHIFVLRIGAVLAIVAIVLASWSGVVATPGQEAHAAAAPASEPRWRGDPSLAGLSVGPDAESGEIEIFY
jgi:hypothetical protein